MRGASRMGSGDTDPDSQRRIWRLPAWSSAKAVRCSTQSPSFAYNTPSIVADSRPMNMTANNAVEAALRGILRGHLFEAANVFVGRAQPTLDL